jgi:hypothetical protein
MNLLTKILIHFFSIIGSMTVGFTQDIDLTTYDTEEGGLYFDQVLIYSYSDHTGQSADVWIYYSTCSGRFLFDHAAWGREDEMIHYVIAQPDGSYLTFGTEAEGPGNGKTVTVDSVYLEPKEQLTAIPAMNEYLEFIAIPESDQVLAGLESKAFEIRKSKDPSGFEKIHLAKVDFDARLIYAFNQQAQELRLPELFSNGLSVGTDQLITQIESSYTDSNGIQYWSKLILKSIDPATYWAPFREYTVQPKVGEKILEKPLAESLILVQPCY